METSENSGWAFSELDELGPDSPKDVRTQRDALKLLASFIQHSDSKPSNQRILCPPGQEIGTTGCRAPVLLIQDLGITFGEATALNKNRKRREPRGVGRECRCGGIQHSASPSSPAR
jgi:hypothetical protein